MVAPFLPDEEKVAAIRDDHGRTRQDDESVTVTFADGTKATDGALVLIRRIGQ